MDYKEGVRYHAQPRTPPWNKNNEQNQDYCRLGLDLPGRWSRAGRDGKKEETGPWSGRVLLGYLATSGNTENTSANFEAAVNWDGERWHHTLSGRAIGQSQDKDTTAESYKATYEAKFDLTERTYLFGLLDYNKNRFTSYPEQTFQFVGIGRRFIMTDKHELNGEVGVGASQSDVQLTRPGGWDPDTPAERGRVQLARVGRL